MDGTTTKGLFRGPLLVKASFTPSSRAITNRNSQAYQHIFLGPSKSHAAGTKKSKKQGNAAIHGMHTVQPAMICYTVIQVTPRIVALDLHL